MTKTKTWDKDKARMSEDKHSVIVAHPDNQPSSQTVI